MLVNTKTKYVGNEQLECYDCASITELNHGTFFGIMASKHTFASAVPSIKMSESGYYTLKFQEDYNNSFDAFDDIQIPLIFEKLDGQYAEEILTGIKFRISAGWPDDFSSNLSKAEAKELIEEFSIRNTIVECDDNSKDPEKTYAVCVVNDLFKLKYAEITLPQKEQISETIEQIVKRNNQSFSENFEEYLRIMRAIAETDDELYEIKKRKTK